MKMKPWLLCVCMLSLPLTAAAKTTLPDSCGDDKIHFDVKTEKDQSAPAGPADGKALVILAEDQAQSRMGSPFHQETVRYGMGGAWVGANYGNSYFVITVDPGEHHLCVAMDGLARRGVDMTTFTTEAGKTYYFTAQIDVGGRGTAHPGGANGGGKSMMTSLNIDFGLTKLDEDQGKYRIKAWKLATSKPKK